MIRFYFIAKSWGPSCVSIITETAL